MGRKLMDILAEYDGRTAQGAKVDLELMNFDQEHELNHFLRKHGKKQSVENRDKVKQMGDSLKLKLSSKVLTHAQMDEHYEDYGYIPTKVPKEPQNKFSEDCS